MNKKTLSKREQTLSYKVDYSVDHFPLYSLSLSLIYLSSKEKHNIKKYQY